MVSDAAAAVVWQPFRMLVLSTRLTQEPKNRGSTDHQTTQCQSIHISCHCCEHHLPTFSAHCLARSLLLLPPPDHPLPCSSAGQQHLVSRQHVHLIVFLFIDQLGAAAAGSAAHTCSCTVPCMLWAAHQTTSSKSMASLQLEMSAAAAATSRRPCQSHRRQVRPCVHACIPPQ